MPQIFPHQAPPAPLAEGPQSYLQVIAQRESRQAYAAGIVPSSPHPFFFRMRLSSTHR